MDMTIVSCLYHLDLCLLTSQIYNIPLRTHSFHLFRELIYFLEIRSVENKMTFEVEHK